MIGIVCALCVGVLVAIARTLNGRLAQSCGSLYASWINHLVAFAALSVLVFSVSGLPGELTDIPPYLLLGGVVGAVYVSLNAYVVPHLGVTLATLLIIAGQLVASILIDSFSGSLHWRLDSTLIIMLLGFLLLGFGFFKLLER